MTILFSLLFGSHIRYLQRRANQLWRYLEAQQPSAEPVELAEN